MCPTRTCLFLLAPVLFLIGARLFLKSSASARMSIAVNLMGWDGVGEILKETFAQRWLGQKQTSSRTEFIGLLDALMEADEKYLSPTGRAVIDPDDIAEDAAEMLQSGKAGARGDMGDFDLCRLQQLHGIFQTAGVQ